MYVIIVYDIAQKRVTKLCKFLRKYLHWVQNSAFEGEVSEGQLFEIKKGIGKIIKKQDSVLIYETNNPRWLKKEIVGKEKNPVSNII